MNRKYNISTILIVLLATEVIFWVSFLLFYFVLANFIEGFRIGNKEILWALAVIPPMVLGFILLLRWKNNALGKFAAQPLLKHLVTEVSTIKSLLKFLFIRYGLTFLILAMAAPKLGTKKEEVVREGVDIMIALDVSNSMLAMDLKPNRLERAKRAIQQLVDHLAGDRVGMIVFGGQAYVQLPITTDYSAAKLFLSTISTDIVPNQGTAIGAAIDLATQSFNMESSSGKAVIVITDGENHEDDAEGAARAAQEMGIQVHAIGVGSPSGEPIPIVKNGRTVGYKKDKEGNTVITKLNESKLQQVALAGNGSYIRSNNSNFGLDILLREMNKMEKAELGSTLYSHFEDRFQLFLWIALVFFVLEQLLTERKYNWLNTQSLFNKND